MSMCKWTPSNGEARNWRRTVDHFPWFGCTVQWCQRCPDNADNHWCRNLRRPAPAVVTDELAHSLKLLYCLMILHFLSAVSLNRSWSDRGASRNNRNSHRNNANNRLKTGNWYRWRKWQSSLTNTGKYIFVQNDPDNVVNCVVHDQNTWILTLYNTSILPVASTF
jgi:hypothetical protein